MFVFVDMIILELHISGNSGRQKRLKIFRFLLKYNKHIFHVYTNSYMYIIKVT